MDILIYRFMKTPLLEGSPWLFLRVWELHYNSLQLVFTGKGFKYPRMMISFPPQQQQSSTLELPFDNFQVMFRLQPNGPNEISSLWRGVFHPRQQKKSGTLSKQTGKISSLFTEKMLCFILSLKVGGSRIHSFHHPFFQAFTEHFRYLKFQESLPIWAVCKAYVRENPTPQNGLTR